MAHYKEKLHTINTFIFDFDGVLSNGKVWVLPDGDQIRATDVKDGYAIHYALKCGYNVCIISGGYSESMRKRYDLFPGMDIFLKVADKMQCLQEYMQRKNLRKEQILCMGDDIPDYQILQACGLKCCPNDAAVEIQGIADYISPFKGGEGCVRDVIEQTLRCQDKWFKEGCHIW
ncbi:MAG: HAD hydrolase family protein [Bacteroidales bacterium]|nr:HAD hydrolase family protein [Bacteroidales bacterium]